MRRSSPTPARGPRRDRHGRRYRGPLAWPPAPSATSRRASFDDAVLRAVEDAENAWRVSAAEVEIGVEEVPPSDPSAWEDAVPLGRAFPAQGRLKPRMVIYRLPIQTRAHDRAERDALVRHVVRAQLATLLGRSIDEEDDL